MDYRSPLTANGRRGNRHEPDSEPRWSSARSRRCCSASSRTDASLAVSGTPRSQNAPAGEQRPARHVGQWMTVVASPARASASASRSAARVVHAHAAAAEALGDRRVVDGERRAVAPSGTRLPTLTPVVVARERVDRPVAAVVEHDHGDLEPLLHGGDQLARRPSGTCRRPITTKTSPSGPVVHADAERRRDLVAHAREAELEVRVAAGGTRQP